MAIHIDVSTTRVTSYEEYADYLAENVDMTDDASVIESAEWLAALNNNKTLFIDILNQELLLPNESPDSKFLSHHSLVLGRGIPKRGGRGFAVRLNIWPVHGKTSLIQAHRENVDQAFSYGYPHDHNFSLLTCGFFGPGYATDIYEYDPDVIIGLPGETVEMKYLERAFLKENDVLFFRKSTDIHIQLPPVSISMSLNLLPEQIDDDYAEQYVFDTGNKKITDYILGSRISGRAAIIQTAAEFGIVGIVPTLVDILRLSRIPRLRSAAFQALNVLDNSNREYFLEIASRDSSALVRQLSQTQLSKDMNLAARVI